MPELSTIDAIVRILGAGGVLAGAIIVIFMLHTERWVPMGRLREANIRTEKAEAQRDEALAGWRGQIEATKEVTTLQRETLDYVRDAFPQTRRSRAGRGPS